MAEIRCPNCGKNNPDILDVCQFCQTPLKPDSVLHIGDSPTKKNTGELESVLPDWLKDVRQQARSQAEEDAAQAVSHPKAQKEPPDLLAGLASQASASNEEEVPDWLASINPVAKPKPQAPSTPAPESDFFARFNQDVSQSASEPPHEEIPADSAAASSSASEDRDELSEWFTQAAEQPEEPFELESDTHLEAGWGSTFETPKPARQEPPPKEEEDLSWLRNLEETAKQTGDLKAPKQERDWTADFEMPAAPGQSSGSAEDLSWLDSLGGIEEPQQPTFEQTNKPPDDLSWLDQFGGVPASQAPEVPEEKPAPQEDLSWLHKLGAASEPAQPFEAAPEQSISPEPFASQEDWLNSLGGISQPAQPFNESIPAVELPSSESSSQEDLSWLNELGTTSEPAQPAEAGKDLKPSSEEDLSWLKGLGGEEEPLSAPPFAEPEPAEKITPRQTAPLGTEESHEEIEPDWLREATQTPSMPPPGDLSMDWFGEKSEPVEEQPAPSTPQPAPFADFFSTPGESPSAPQEDADSLFSLEMPDWLSRPEPTAAEEPSSPQNAVPSESPEALAPADLPSWVQAMRPVEAAISETTPGVQEQPEEKEGPLAGLRGVIPGAVIGSSRRPKPISLKLQATDEQQTSAALLEQILATETSPRALVTPSFVASQQMLRWALTGLFLLVLGAVIALRSQIMPIPGTLPAEASGISTAMMSIPAGSNVLVVIDYEPSLTGEMEAISGPLLNQMVQLGHPNLSFVSTSPNGSALVERLMADAKISQPAPEGLGYQAGTQYQNLGFLPGGSAGILGFLENPGAVIPASGVGSLSDYTALVLITDHAESGRLWVEQLQSVKQIDPALANQPLLVVASAQAAPLLEPYVSSKQIAGMLSGLSDAARYEQQNNIAGGTARSYWDAFGVGLLMAIASIIVGALWSVFVPVRNRRPEGEQG
jgi:hypothetical protein